MKILFIHSEKTDYVQDLLYSGLCQVLGGENIVDFPFSSRYRFTAKEYPRNIGFNPAPLAKQLRSRFDFQFSGLRQIDAVIVASCKKSTFETYLKLLKRIPRACQIIFVDGGDSEEIGGDLRRESAYQLYEEALRLRPFNVIFKREYLSEATHEKNVLAFPISFDLRFAPIESQAKKFDVTFWGVESAPIRTEALKKLEGRFDCDSNGTATGQKFNRYDRTGAQYLKDLQSCKIVLNFRGAGWDTLRYWETFAVGSFLISQAPAIQMPNPFIDCKHYVKISNNLEDLIEKCEYYLRHEIKREQIAVEGALHFRRHHTSVHRAKYLLSELSKA